jgi:hypothetical protein
VVSSVEPGGPAGEPGCAAATSSSRSTATRWRTRCAREAARGDRRPRAPAGAARRLAALRPAQAKGLLDPSKAPRARACLAGTRA